MRRPRVGVALRCFVPHPGVSMPFGIGPVELIIVLVIALVVFGPKRLPDLGRSLGGGMREFKNSIAGRDVHEELRAGEPARRQEPSGHGSSPSWRKRSSVSSMPHASA